LRKRGLKANEIHENLREISSLQYFEKGKNLQHFPALLSAIRGSSGDLIGIQRIYLTKEGAKAPVSVSKKILGSMKGGAVVFGSRNDGIIAITEGIETALAVREATGLHTFATVSASGMEDIHCDAQVETVHIFADKDRSHAGLDAAESLARKLIEIGKTVFIHLPVPDVPDKSKGIDWLDIYCSEGAAPLRACLESENSWAAGHERIAPLNLVSLKELFKKPDEEIDFLVDGLLIKGGASLLAGKPKAGKSTLARVLIFNVASGTDFLGLETFQGAVIYLALEEKESEVKRHFRDMGASGAEPIFVLSSSLPEKGLADLPSAIERFKPVLVVIDPLFRAVRVADENKYSLMTAALEKVISIARNTGTHIMCVHHLGKGDRSGADAILGSTAIRGAFDANLMLQRKNDQRTITSEQRYGDDLEETILNYDPVTRVIHLGDAQAVIAKNNIKNEILHFLGSATTPQTESDIDSSTPGKTVSKRAALRELFAEHKILRTGHGGKGDPFKYQKK
jgi:hypothetical protein